MMTEYNKLVRDKIPEIMRKAGKECVIRVLEEEAYCQKLDEKLEEELKEYLVTGDTSELADLIEVVYAILASKDISIESFEFIREKKAAARGRFEKKLLLERVSD
jgi:predicted house-cleaning noncanonical NTP pyrophosphatase (MazG superfamily)